MVDAAPYLPDKTYRISISAIGQNEPMNPRHRTLTTAAMVHRQSRLPPRAFSPAVTLRSSGRGPVSFHLENQRHEGHIPKTNHRWEEKNDGESHMTRDTLKMLRKLRAEQERQAEIAAMLRQQIKELERADKNARRRPSDARDGFRDRVDHRKRMRAAYRRPSGPKTRTPGVTDAVHLDLLRGRSLRDISNAHGLPLRWLIKHASRIET